MTNFWSTFILIIVIVHFIIGIGYLIVKLSPKKEGSEE
jgi:L-asparagine transporter-like permease